MNRPPATFHEEANHIVAEGFEFPEGPCWTETGTLILVDLVQRSVFELTSRGRSVLATAEGSPNGAAISPSGNLIIADNGGRWPATPSTGHTEGYATASGQLARCSEGELEPWLGIVEGVSLDAPNDLCFDARGGVYFTDPHWGEEAVEAPHHGALIYRAADGSASRCATGIRFPNGVCLSPDGQVLYVTETRSGFILRAAVEAPGKLGSFDIYAELSNDTSPDGIACDQAGNLLVAGSTAGRIFAIEAHNSRRVSSVLCGDENVTNLCFGGDDLKTLFITEATRGRVTATEWSVPGVPLPKEVDQT